MPNIQGKCLVLDIDYVIVGNLDDILSWDLPNKHFGCQERWWSNLTGYCNINGGFQMFYQGDTMDLYNKFYESPKYWQRYYIQRGEAKGPVNGEQNFIDNHCKLERSWLPPEWFAKYKRDQIFDIQCLWSKRINSEDYFFMCNEFHEDIKMVHFSDAENTMHESDDDWLRYYWYG